VPLHLPRAGGSAPAERLRTELGSAPGVTTAARSLPPPDAARSHARRAPAPCRRGTRPLHKAPLRRRPAPPVPSPGTGRPQRLVPLHGKGRERQREAGAPVGFASGHGRSSSRHLGWEIVFRRRENKPWGLNSPWCADRLLHKRDVIARNVICIVIISWSCGRCLLSVKFFQGLPQRRAELKCTVAFKRLLPAPSRCSKD